MTVGDMQVVKINLLHGECGCTQEKTCEKYKASFMKRMIDKYVGNGCVFRGQIESAIIDLRNFNYDNYITQVKKIHKGNAFRDSKKAEKAGFYAKQFVWKNHIPDIVEINQSKETRSGGKMKDAYLRSVEEMGGYPEKYHTFNHPECPVHCTYNWGIFQEISGYKQGDIITNEKLLAYIKFKRNGNYATYTSILGHGDYLKYGIMNKLHYSIMDWIEKNKSDALKGLDFLMYGAIQSGGEGLMLWKKRALFEGAYLVYDQNK